MMNSLNDASVARLIEIALIEDIQTGDITSESTIDSEDPAKATILYKQDGIVCGLPIARLVFASINSSIDFNTSVKEGARIEAGTVAAKVKGPAIDILKGERVALNFMQRMSGVATLTRSYVEAIEGTGATILDTRKTIPGWRILDKYAVRTGGAKNHRFGLHDMVLIKDNHIAAAGGIKIAVERCLDAIGDRDIKIEVEAADMDQVRTVLECEGVHRIMFDNFTPDLMREAVELVGDKLETEASGGINLQTARMYAETGVKYLSVGALTHSATALDISMNIG